MFKRAILSTCGLALLALPLVSFAQSASCPVLTRMLTVGSTGDDVRALQRFLINEGELISGAASGTFGLSTEQAVKGWQWSKRIVTSKDDLGFGIVGPKTRAAISAVCKISAPVNSGSTNFPYFPTSSTTPSQTISGSTIGKCASQAPKAACTTSWQGKRGADGCVASWYCISISTRNFTTSSSTTFFPFVGTLPSTVSLTGASCTTSAGATVSAGQTAIEGSIRYVCSDGQWYVLSTGGNGSGTSTSTTSGTTTAGVGSIFSYWCPNGVGGAGYWSQTPCQSVDTPPNFSNPTNLDYTYGSSANVKAGTLCAPEGRQEFIACPYMANCFQGGTYLICRNAIWTPFN